MCLHVFPVYVCIFLIVVCWFLCVVRGFVVHVCIYFRLVTSRSSELVEGCFSPDSVLIHEAWMAPRCPHGPICPPSSFLMCSTADCYLLVFVILLSVSHLLLSLYCILFSHIFSSFCYFCSLLLFFLVPPSTSYSTPSLHSALPFYLLAHS